MLQCQREIFQCVAVSEGDFLVSSRDFCFRYSENAGGVSHCRRESTLSGWGSTQREIEK